MVIELVSRVMAMEGVESQAYNCREPEPRMSCSFPAPFTCPLICGSRPSLVSGSLGHLTKQPLADPRREDRENTPYLASAVTQGSEFTGLLTKSLAGIRCAPHRGQTISWNQLYMEWKASALTYKHREKLTFKIAIGKTQTETTTGTNITNRRSWKMREREIEE